MEARESRPPTSASKNWSQRWTVPNLAHLLVSGGERAHGRRRYSLVGVHVAEEPGAVCTEVRIARIRVLREVVGSQRLEMADDGGVPVAMQCLPEPPLILHALQSILRQGPWSNVSDQVEGTQLTEFSLDGMIHVFLSERDRRINRTFLPGFAVPTSVPVSMILVRPGIATNVHSVESMATATNES